jgi:lysyl-tRNA synthetase class 2
MNDTEKMFQYIARGLNIENNKIIYQGKEIDLTPPWPRLTVREVFQNYVKIDLDVILDRDSLTAAALAKGYAVGSVDRFDDIFFKIFLNEIEPQLIQPKPVIIFDWPAEMAALARKKKSDPRYAERFEVYAGGLELGNAFSELIDPEEQKKRLLEEKSQRAELKKNVYDIDDDFIEALSSGIPSSGGIAMGVDRIVMLFTDSKNIEEVQFFPAKDIF